MSLPEFTKKMVEAKLAKYCAEKIPDHARHQIRITFKIRGNSVTLFEERPYYQDNSIWTIASNKITQFYRESEKKWGTVGTNAIRGMGGTYNGPERRLMVRV